MVKQKVQNKNFLGEKQAGLQEIANLAKSFHR